MASARWISLAIASGACAALNGVFAKLTTGTDGLTTRISHLAAETLGLTSARHIAEFAARAIFFTLNLVFNATMWSLFTTALARASSTTQVSVVNTSSNFFLTAILGLIVFSETLPPLWWAGAAFLVIGNVVIVSQKDDSIPVPATDLESDANLVPLLADRQTPGKCDPLDSPLSGPHG